MNKELEEFFNNREIDVETLREEYISFGEWGSGEDRIKITDEMFFEFAENLRDKIIQGEKQ